jgi:hypothetical protein
VDHGYSDVKPADFGALNSASRRIYGDQMDETSSWEALTTDVAGSMANGAAHDHRAEDEQRDLEEHQETESSVEGPHQRSVWLAY